MFTLLTNDLPIVLTNDLPYTVDKRFALYCSGFDVIIYIQLLGFINYMAWSGAQTSG